MAKLISNQGNAIKNHNEIPLKKKVIPNTDINKLLCVGGNVNGYNHSEEKVAISSKNENIPYDLSSNCIF